VIVLWQYLALLAVPLQLSADYSFNQVPVAAAWDDPRFLLGGALLLALAVMAAVAARRAPVVAVAALFTAVPLALTANLLFPIGTIKAERLLYLPSLGWCLAGGWFAALAVRQRARLATLALAALLLGFATRTWLRNRDWRDEQTLFAVTLHDAPGSAKAHYNGAVRLQRAGRLDEAMLHYRRALEIFPDYSAAAFGIGNIYGLQGADGGALYWYEQALRRDPQFANAHLQLGLLHERHGAYDCAEAAFLTGLASEPNNPLLLVNLGALRLGQGDRWRAQAALLQLDGIGTLDPDEHELLAAARHEIEVALR
jgi:tetratricopeptide (TPR) repeat protein